MTLKQQEFVTYVIIYITLIASCFTILYALSVCLIHKLKISPTHNSITNKVEAITPEQWLYMGSGQ